jgi:hypothetical protein
MGVRDSIIIAGVCMSLCVTACNKTETVVSGNTPTTALIMSSFEVGGLPSLKGWTSNSSDTSVVGFSTDTPPGGGRFSVRLQNEWTSGGNVRAGFPAPSGIHRYKLSVWTKASSQGFASRGTMSIIIKKSHTLFVHQHLSFTDTMWTMLSLADTVETGLSDSIIVSLAGDLGQFSGGWTLFDVCVFEKLD